MEPLHVVTFLWRPPLGYRSKFDGHHVDVLAAMVRRHYPDPHVFHCVTDMPEGITDPSIKVWELWPDLSGIANPSGRKNPSCYRRLRLFASTTKRWLGDRFVCLDLDCVVVGDLRPLWNRPEDFVIWRSATSVNPYNGSMFLHRAGTRTRLWNDFDPVSSPIQTKAAGLYGSDQAWIALKLGRNEPVWTKADGVFSYRIDLSVSKTLPPGARIVFFHGKPDPWEGEAQRVPWVRENYR